MWLNRFFRRLFLIKLIKILLVYLFINLLLIKLIIKIILLVFIFINLFEFIPGFKFIMEDRGPSP